MEKVNLPHYSTNYSCGKMDSRPQRKRIQVELLFLVLSDHILRSHQGACGSDNGSSGTIRVERMAKRDETDGGWSVTVPTYKRRRLLGTLQRRYHTASRQRGKFGHGRDKTYFVSKRKSSESFEIFKLKLVMENIFRDPNGKKIGEYGGKVNLKEFNLWIPKKK